MPLIPAAHVNLAGPPSLQSCTRDVYPPGFQLSVALALGIASDVAGAVAYLHQRGVMHGDLYAHNILIDPVHGQARLGDFGAATRLPTDQPELRQSLLALEVRAMGCLLEELALRHMRTADHPAVEAMQNLAQNCLADQPRQRPSVMEVAQALEAIEGLKP
jgi:predicted unusual protein kinase regulating ubiquinone biosynthesis (AarF/ABC1/UbiB family)